MFNKILVCLDGSELAEQILPYATEQALKFNSELILFRVYPEPHYISVALPGFPGVPLETRAMEEGIQKAANESATYLNRIGEGILSQSGITAQSVSVLGVAGEAIVNYAGENSVELIAIATHGRSGIGRVVIGSVVDFVLRHTDIPILLIRPSKPRSR